MTKLDQTLVDDAVELLENDFLSRQELLLGSELRTDTFWRASYFDPEWGGGHHNNKHPLWPM